MNYNVLHRTLIALHRLAGWSWLLVAAAVLGLAGVLALLGLAVGGALIAYAAVAFLLFVGLDGALLGLLPRLALSFGPVQPALLALAAVRWLIGLIGLVAALWLAPFWVLPAVFVVHVALSLLVAYACFVEPFRLTVTRLEVRSPKLAGLDRPLSVLHLSDLHMERPTRRDRRILRLAEELAPDLILLTGDYLNLSYTDDDLAVASAREWLSLLRAPLGVFAVLGTPEVDVRHRVDDVFVGTGVRLLRNEAATVSPGGSAITLLGVTCERDGYSDLAGLEAAVSQVPEGAFTILLYHLPDLMPEAVVRRIDIYLAGHTHGGQWRLPGYGALITSSAYGKRYEMGRYVEGDTLLYVTRGLGLEGLAAPRARVLCPPEVLLLSLEATRDEGGRQEL
jgi:predicted MPP superfamily phosphohydrolase